MNAWTVVIALVAGSIGGIVGNRLGTWLQKRFRPEPIYKRPDDWTNCGSQASRIAPSRPNTRSVAPGDIGTLEGARKAAQRGDIAKFIANLPVEGEPYLTQGPDGDGVWCIATNVVIEPNRCTFVPEPYVEPLKVAAPDPAPETRLTNDERDQVFDLVGPDRSADTACRAIERIIDQRLAAERKRIRTEILEKSHLTNLRFGVNVHRIEGYEDAADIADSWRANMRRRDER